MRGLRGRGRLVQAGVEPRRRLGEIARWPTACMSPRDRAEADHGIRPPPRRARRAAPACPAHSGWRAGPALRSRRLTSRRRSRRGSRRSARLGDRARAQHLPAAVVAQRDDGRFDARAHRRRHRGSASTSPPSDAATCAARGRADRRRCGWPKARRAAGRSRSSSARIAGCAGQRSATVGRPGGHRRQQARHPARSGSTSVSGPGQKRCGQRSRALVELAPAARASARSGDVDDQRVEVGPALGAVDRRHRRRRCRRARRGRRPSRSAPRPARRRAAAAAARGDARRIGRSRSGECVVAAMRRRYRRDGPTKPRKSPPMDFTPAHRRPGLRARRSMRRDRRAGRSTSASPRPSPTWSRRSSRASAQFAAGECAPLNRIGDTEGAKLVERRGDAARRLRRGLPRLCRAGLERDRRARGIRRPGPAVQRSPAACSKTSARPTWPSRCCRC